MRRCAVSLYRCHGGQMLLDVKLWSTLEPHAEKLTLEAIPVDPSESGLVLPFELASSDVPRHTTSSWMIKLLGEHEPLHQHSLDTLRTLAAKLGVPEANYMDKERLESVIRSHAVHERNTKKTSMHLLKDIFQSWPRLYHQREFERPYAGCRISVLELGPFEVHFASLERPFVTNVQFSPDLPRRADGMYDIRIGGDIARRSHYLAAEMVEGGLLNALHGITDVSDASLAPIGAVPRPSAGRTLPGKGRLYRDDAVRMGWSVVDGKIRKFPPVPLSQKIDRTEEQWAERKMGLEAAQEIPEPTATPPKPARAAKEWGGWRAA
eukprot:Sspe_Gene.37176::Locus_17933_Transcript_1_1_Confidence_1.000_Length_1176::g.37176::m.37176